MSARVVCLRLTVVDAPSNPAGTASAALGATSTKRARIPQIVDHSTL